MVEGIEALKKQWVNFANSIQDSINSMRPSLEAFAVTADKFQKQFALFIEQFSETYGTKIAEFAKQAKKWQEKQKLNVSEMAAHGWFPNWFTFFFQPKEKYDNIDDFMIAHIDQCWDELKIQIIKHSPKRKHILEVAFALHEQGNYIASIPLLLMQSDGICSEEFTYFFTKDHQTGKKASDEIIYQAENSQLVVNFFSEILLEPFKVNLQISQSASKASKIAKKNGPNRHGVIHGSRKHLDYGSKINGYKAVSFLAFIVYAIKDEFKNHNKRR